jgi:hypothetical protein
MTLVMGLGVGSVSAGVATSAAPAATAVPAYWAQHDEIDELQDLPAPYSCDDLYYKYRDVLLRVGARPGMKIYAYGCMRGGKPGEGTPRVDLTYAVPRELIGSAAGDAAFKATLSTIRIGPGEPKSLTARDCVLLNDMRQTVLSSIANSVDASSLHCDSARASRHFSLLVQTLLPTTMAASPPAS